MGLIRWIISLAVLSVWVAFVGTALYVAIYEPPEEVAEAQAIVVLGGAGDGVDGVGPGTAVRVAKGVELYQQGKAPLLVMTGGGSPVRVGEAMAREARAAGVPDEAILFEAESESTLQNALFTGDFEVLDKTQPIILVTHRYHMPRGWASFRWAGFEDVRRVAADPDAGFVLGRGLILESFKWPLNILRAAAASVAMAGNVPRENYIKYLE